MNFDLFSFCPELQELVTSRRALGRSGKVFEGIGALSSVNNLLTLRSLCLRLKPKRTLEIGLCYGGSGLVFTASHREAGHVQERQQIALDPYQASVWDDTGLLSIDRAGLMGWLDFRPAFSSLELPSLLREKREFDLIYIDGSHLFEDVIVDALFVSKLLAEKGVVLFDDSTNPHVKKVLRFITTNFREILAPFSLESYRDQGGSLRSRLAKLLGRNQLTAFQKLSVSERPWNASFHNF